MPLPTPVQIAHANLIIKKALDSIDPAPLKTSVVAHLGKKRVRVSFVVHGPSGPIEMIRAKGCSSSKGVIPALRKAFFPKGDSPAAIPDDGLFFTIADKLSKAGIH